MEVSWLSFPLNTLEPCFLVYLPGPSWWEMDWDTSIWIKKCLATSLGGAQPCKRFTTRSEPRWKDLSWFVLVFTSLVMGGSFLRSSFVCAQAFGWALMLCKGSYVQLRKAAWARWEESTQSSSFWSSSSTWSNGKRSRYKWSLSESSHSRKTRNFTWGVWRFSLCHLSVCSEANGNGEWKHAHSESPDGIAEAVLGKWLQGARKAYAWDLCTERLSLQKDVLFDFLSFLWS